MITLPLRTWICNAAAVFSGTYGAVTDQARLAGCSRETVYQHARQIEQRLDDTPGPEHAGLLAENQRLRDQLAELTGRFERSIPCDSAKLRQVATVAFACGVSLRQIEDIFAALLGPATAPDHSTIGRWVAREAKKARAVLEPIDAACVAEVEALAVDEVFLGADRPSSASSRRA